MVVFVRKDCTSEYNEKTLAEKLANDLEDFSFMNPWEEISSEILDRPSLAYYGYKKLFEENGQSNVVVPIPTVIGRPKFNHIDDDILFGYLNALASAAGVAVVSIGDGALVDSKTIAFNPDKDFYVDLLAKLKPLVKKISNDPLNQIVKSINAYGYYLGSTDSEKLPIKIIRMGDYSSGQKISFEEYLKWHLKAYNFFKEISLEEAMEESKKYAFVRSKHPAEIMCKAIEKQQSK